MSFLNNGEAVDEFITREGNTVNTTGLIGEFTLPPGLSATKTGPSTMYIGEWGEFTIGVQNQSEADAHNTTILDILPDGAERRHVRHDAGDSQCTGVRVGWRYNAGPRQGPPGPRDADYSLSYNGATCELTFNTLSAAAVIGVDERLIITYRTQLDTDTQDGALLTNVAGATAWETEDGSTQYRRTLTDGTVGTGDHEDAHTVTAELPALDFQKSVVNVTTGQDPGTVTRRSSTHCVIRSMSRTYEQRPGR